MKKIFFLAALPALLTGCSDRFDYQGIDPTVYNEVIYPKVNQVEYHAEHHSFYFAEQRDQFDSSTLLEMDQFVTRTYPSAISYMELTFGRLDHERQQYVTRLMRSRGLKKSTIQTAVDNRMHPDEVVIEIEYSTVELPHCPDWHKSSTVNYSNTNHSNARCATTVNLGAQIANPAEIDSSATLHVKGDPHTQRTAIERYRSGENNEATDGIIETGTTSN